MKNFSVSLIKYSLFLLATFIPFSTSGIGISVSLLAVGVLVFYFSRGNFILHKEAKKIFYLMLGIVLIMTLSTLFSYDLLSSIKRTITVLGYFFIFVSVFIIDDKEYLKKVVYVLIFLCVLHSIYAILQYFTGVDIVKWQILVSAGEKIDFKDITLRGHTIECRINAEDPFDDFAPSIGKITKFIPPGGPFVRVDTHLYEGYTISPFYDSLIAKVIVWGKDREEAIQRMKRALKEFVIVGVKTTIPLHLKILDDSFFIKGQFHTNFLQRRILSEE